MRSIRGTRIACNHERNSKRVGGDWFDDKHISPPNILNRNELPKGKPLMKLARPAGFEPTTLGFGGQYSDPLSYGRCAENARFALKSAFYQHCHRGARMAEHDQHSSFIKTPQQLITVVTMANRAGGNLKEPAKPKK